MNSKCEHNIVIVIFITLSLFLSSFAMAEEFNATVNWSKRVELSSSVNGIVKKVLAQAGKIVAAGEVLVQLDSRSFKADLKYAKANFKNTNERNLEAKRELDRQLDMYDRSMLSEHELQVAKNNFTSAQSQFFQSQASLTKAKLNLEYSAVRAPFNAIVIKILSTKGMVVTTDISPPTLVIVAEAKRMLAIFDVPMGKVNELALNQSVKVVISNQVYQGEIHNIAFEQSKMGYYSVDVIFDSKDNVLRAGQKATVDL